MPLTTYAELLESAPVLPALRIEPASIVVVPEYVLVALKVSGWDPETVTCPAPEMALGKVTELVLVKVIVPLLVMAEVLVGVKPTMASL